MMQISVALHKKGEQQNTALCLSMMLVKLYETVTFKNVQSRLVNGIFC